MEKNEPRALLRSCRSRVNLNIVRKLVKLALVFSLSFAILFIISTGLRFLALRVAWVQTLSQEQEIMLVDLITAARWALSLGIFGGVLHGLSYAARREVFTPAAIFCVGLLAIGTAYGISQILESWENVSPEKTPTQSLGKPGLILANSTRPTSTVIVLLQGPAQPDGSRVVATPGRPLLYQESFAGKDLSLHSLPPAPFGDDSPWFLKSLAIDLRLNAEMMRQRLGDGLLSFIGYTGALVFLLCSLIFILKLTEWPLANLILGCLAFRGVLALEVFFNTPEIQDVFDSLLQGRLPLPMVVPSIFGVVGLLAVLYTFLVYLVRRQREYVK